MTDLGVPEKIIECSKVVAFFLYFLLTYVWIEAKDSGEAIRFDPWPDQGKIIPKIISSLRLVVLKARQLGLTWIVAAYCLWAAITKPLQLIVIVSSKEQTAREFLDRVKFIKARLPKWLLPAVARETTEELEFIHTDEHGHPVNSIIKSLPTTSAGAQSKTPTILVIDEAHESADVGSLFSASKPGIDAAHGQIIVIANSIKNRPGWPWVRSIFQGAINGINDFTPIFLPWWSHPERSREPVADPIYGTIPRFRSEQYRGGMTKDDFSFHYPETAAEALQTLGGSYFGEALSRHPAPTLVGQVGTLIAPEKPGDVPRFQVDAPGQQASILTVWHPPYWLQDDYLPGRFWTDRYCVGVDVSEGLGQSYSVAYVFDRVEDEFAARLRSNRISAHNLAPILYWLAQWYRNALYVSHDTGIVTWDNAMIAVERTGAGQTTVGILEEMGATQYQRQIVGKLGDHITSQLGWHESQQAKYDLSEALRNWFATTKGALHCPLLLDEAGTWIQHDGTKKLGPEEGHLGDCVMAAGVTIQCSLAMGGSPKMITVTSNATNADRRLIRLARIPERDEEEGYYDVMDEQEVEEDSYTVDYVSLGKMGMQARR